MGQAAEKNGALPETMTYSPNAHPRLTVLLLTAAQYGSIIASHKVRCGQGTVPITTNTIGGGKMAKKKPKKPKKPKNTQ